jgi:hypothetical protein
VLVTVPAGQTRDVYPALAARLREALPSLATDINAAVGQEVTEYSRPIEGLFGRNLTLGVERALAAFVDLLEEPGQPTLPRTFYLELGRGELRQGRGLDALLSAYRVGARVAWRTVGDLAVEAGAPPQLLVELAELLFTYIDGLSALSVRGYAEEQAARAGERDRRRAELARLLITGVDEPTLRELAVLARWPLPERLAAVLLPRTAPSISLPWDALIWPRDEDVVALVPCTAEFGLTQLRKRLKGVPAVVGSLVLPREVRQSLAAAEALSLIEVASDRQHSEPILVDDHLLDLVLRADPALLERLSRQLLAPLETVPESARERLAVTLLAWLAHAGARNAVAQALHVHPQTVRYRMTQLREAFGPALEDPEQRTALTLVLRASCGPVPGAGGGVTRDN